MTDDERDDLEVAVDYDGLVQRLGADGKAVSGSAQPFRDARAGRGDVQDCGGEWRTTPGSRVEVGCSMTPTFTPYLPGIGWADDGRTFVVVDLQLNVIDVRVGDRAVAPGALRLSPSIDVGGPVTPDPAIARALTGTGAGLVSRDFYELPAASTPVLQLDSQLWGVVASTSVAIEGP